MPSTAGTFFFLPGTPISFMRSLYWNFFRLFISNPILDIFWPNTIIVCFSVIGSLNPGWGVPIFKLLAKHQFSPVAYGYPGWIWNDFHFLWCSKIRLRTWENDGLLFNELNKPTKIKNKLCNINLHSLFFI